MPYLLPSDPDVPERACILVFYPDAPEYRRALFGQIAELTDVWNWEGTREAQAMARVHWLDAERQTLECWSMACLDDILAVLESIRDAPCCDTLDEVPGDGGDIVGVDDTTAPPDDVDVDSGVIPDGFTDVPDYQAYLCGAAHQFAGSTDEAVDTISTIILVASNILVFATLIVLAFGNVIGMGIAAILAGGYSLVTVSEVFGFFSLFTELREVLRGGDPGGTQAQTKSELAAIYDDIVNAIACSNSSGEATAALHALLDANVTSANYRGLLKLLWNAAFIAAIYKGFSNAADRFDCDCTTEQLPDNFYMVDLNPSSQWMQPDILSGNHQIRNVAFADGILSFEKYNVTGFTYNDRALMEGTVSHTDPLVGVVFDWTTGGAGDITYTPKPITQLGGTSILTSNFNITPRADGERTLVTIQSSDADYPTPAALAAIAADEHPTPSVNNKVLKTGTNLALEYNDGAGADGDFRAKSFNIKLVFKGT